MREIKFRAWGKENSHMYYDLQLGLYHLKTGNFFSDIAKALSTASLESIILMQFTGLKDKNGKEIYEGDILGVFSFSGDFANRNEPFGKVYFDEDLGAFCVEQTNGGWEYLNKVYDQPKVSVIGNIYENPELLK